MTPTETEFLISKLMDMMRKNAASAATVAMKRLDDLEAGRFVHPLESRPKPPTEDDVMGKALYPFVLAQIDVVQSELDALTPRVKALMKADEVTKDADVSG